MKKHIKVLTILAMIFMICLCFSACKEKEEQGFVLSFETNGGKNIESYRTNIIEEIPLTEKDGCYLDGWYSDSNFKNQITFPYQLKQDTTLHARWITERSGSPNIVYSFNEDSNTYTVTGYTGKSHNIIIPQTFEGKDVNSISDGAFNVCHTVQKIYIPDSISVIGKAFYRCINLTEIIVSLNNQDYKTIEGVLYSKNGEKLISYPPAKQGDIFVIPDSVTSIENSAIRFCNNIKQITVSQNVINIEKYFDGCLQLQTISVSEKNPKFKSVDGVLCNKDGKTLLRYPQNFGSDTYNIPSGVEIINDYAFSQSSVVCVHIPETVKQIPLFEDCRKLTQIDVDKNNGYYKSISGVLFDKAAKTLLQYPQARAGEVYRIQDDKNDYYEYHIPDGVETIANRAFYCIKKINRVIVPSSVKFISDYAFTDIDQGFNLYEVIFSENSNLQAIDDNAFVDCPLKLIILTSVLPPALQKDTFIGEDKNFIVYVPEDTFELYENSLWNTFNLQKGKIAPKYTVNFHTNSQETLADLQTACMMQEITPIKQEHLFAGWYDNELLQGEKISFPLAVTKNITLYAKWYSKKSGTPGLTYKFISETNSYSVSGYNGHEQIVEIPTVHNEKIVTAISAQAFSQKTFIKKVILPQTILEIGNYAFSGNSDKLMALESVVFNDTELIKIGNYAFQNCPLIKSINLPITLEFIGNGAFAHCKMLESCYIPKNVNQINAYAFSGCDNLKSINVDTFNQFYMSDDGILYDKNQLSLIKYPQAKSNEVFSMPNQTQRIFTEAFYGAYNLKSILFPKNLTEIGARAFYYCASLESVELPVSLKEFNSSIFRFSSIKNITLSAGVEILQDNFHNLDYLENIHVSPNNNFYKSIDGVLFSKDGKTLIRYPMGRRNIYILPLQTEIISEKAFFECNLNGVVLNEGLKSISKEAFGYCKNISQIDLVESLVNIDDYAFVYATSLRTINIYSQSCYPTLGTYVFAGTRNHWGVTVYAPDALIDQLQDDIQWNTNEILCNSVIMDNFELVLVNDEYFKVLKVISNEIDITIPQTINDKEIREIHSYAFNNIVRRVSLPQTITVIHDYAFTSDNSCLLTVILEGGENDINIDSNAFYNCNNLTSLIIKSNNAPIINSNTSLFEISSLRVYVKDIEKYSSTPFAQCEIYDSDDIYEEFFVIAEAEGLVAKSYVGIDSNIIIPSTINASSVIAVGDYVINALIQKVIVSEGIKYLYDYAFSNEKYNNEIYFPVLKEILIEGQTLISIGQKAFFGAGITQLNLPSSIENIHYMAFQNCIDLKSVNIDTANSVYRSIDGILYNKDMTIIIYYPSGKIQAEFVIADTVGIVAKNAFQNAINLNKIILGEQTQVIESNAFSGCVRLLEVVFSDGLIRIESFAFRGCQRLFSLNLSKELSEFNQTAVIDCKNMEIIYIDNSNEDYLSVDGVLFDKSMQRLIRYPEGKEGSYEVPESIRYISPYAFYGSLIKSIIIPQSVIEIGEYAFSDCKNLMNMSIGESIVTLPQAMVKNCTALESLIIPTDVTTIENYFAENCTALKNVTFSEGVENIGARAFAGCVNLNNIVLPKGLKTLGEQAFLNCRNIISFSIPNSLEHIGESILKGINNLNSIYMGINFPLNYLFGILDKDIPNALNNIYINEGVSSIPYGFFENYINIKNVIIPSTIRNIQDNAFKNCFSLETVEIKGAYTLEFIGEEAFWNCYNLSSVKLMIVEPAVIHHTTFKGYYNGTTETLRKLWIYTPKNSIDAYKNAWGLENVLSLSA